MTLAEAVELDSTGRALGYVGNDETVVARCSGPPHNLTARKRRKWWRGTKVWIFTAGRGYRMDEMSPKVRKYVNSLRWEPENPRDAVSMLGDLG